MKQTSNPGQRNAVPEQSSLSYRETPASAAAVTLLSLFCQWLNWFAYEKLDYPWGFTLITPLILCIMYHFVQLDSVPERKPEDEKPHFTRRFVYIFAALLPFLVGVLITVLMLLSNPQISVFDPDEDYAGTIPEVIAIYAGRFTITSLYLMIFGIIDIPLLNMADNRKK
ncbi:MAG: hypothetical protein IJ874_08845 [Ruminococcus sp.]|nr:hypothetical protein [Ruminococcus sp.]